MALSRSGLGTYEILAPLGAGGMGEVYRAKDTKLGREVALKILPATFTSDPDRVARFRREAQVLAALNHPHIAQIYGLDEANATHFLVLELVDGESLDKRIARGKIPVNEALAIAKQIAEALEAAHEKGIIHRDLKPANIALTRDGDVKVLDFGLAKALGTSGPVVDLTNSPTVAPMTMHATILGTAAYMSPEQAKGHAVDKRADIWAFGVVFAEMLAGKAMYVGDTVSEILAAVITKLPDLGILPASTPTAVRQLIARCLERDPRTRLRDIGEARITLERQRADPIDAARDAAEPGAPPRAWLPWAIAAMAIVAAGAVVAIVGRSSQQAPLLPVRFEIGAPDGYTIVAQGLAMSPDGRRIAYSVLPDGAGDDEQTRLAIRSLDSMDARILQGTDGAAFPFWSADSQSVAFFASGKLQRIDVNGGLSQTIAESVQGISGTWNRDGVILFGEFGDNDVISRVSASGGSVTKATHLDPTQHEQWHHTPSFLPDGRHFLYLAGPPAVVYVGSLDSDERVRLTASDTRAIYADGYLLFVRERRLFAQPFDPRTFALSGDAIPIADDIINNPASSMAGISASTTGALIYRAGILTPQMGRLAWFDRAGRQVGFAGNRQSFLDVELSPDGARFAASVANSQTRGYDIWVFDLARDAGTRLTFDDAIHQSPKWSPRGDAIAFQSLTMGRSTLGIKAADGTGQERTVAVTPSPAAIDSWFGDSLVYEMSDPRTSWDLWRLTLDKSRSQPLVQLPGRQEMAAISPDGRWLAYRSTESGRSEIYATRFPDVIGKWQLSVAGGSSPRWRHDGRELYFLSPDRKLMAVPIAGTEHGLAVGRPVPLFETPRAPSVSWPYDVSADGQKFLFNIAASQAQQQIKVVLNWQEELKPRVPTR
jgi:Tol biopolymer transport system component